MKRIMCIALAWTLCLSLSLAAGAEEPVNVLTLKGPTGIGMALMMEENDGTYAFTLAGAPDEAVAAVASGAADIAAVPTNLASTLYAKTGGKVQLLALNTLGVLHILEKGESVQRIEDLEGRTLYATGQGAVPEYVLNYILAQNGLLGKVNVEYKAEHSELATLAAAGQVDLVMLPEPNVTSVLMNNADFREALDVTELFAEAAKAAGQEDTALSMGCVIVRREFAEQSPQKVSAFLDAYAASVAFVNEDASAAAQMVEAQGILPKAAVAERAIPNCHIVFVEGAQMKAQIQPFYEMLFEANPASVGGALPADDFYYAR